MKNILLVQPSMQPPGGGNGVAAWIIEALKRDHAVSLLTWKPIDLGSIDRYYGTSLGAADFRAYGVPPALRRLLALVPTPAGLLKTHLLLRLCKKMKDDYDVIITVNNEADFGRPGIQYIHFPWARLPRPPADLSWYHLSPGVVALYHTLCARLGGFSFDRMKENLTLANSAWTAGKVREQHGIESIVLHPPILDDFPDVPWAERESGFVCIGRIAPEKELEKIIDILASVRDRGHEAHLHIIGTSAHNRYYREILRRVRANASWISLDENLSRDQLVRLVSQHRYGIHGMEEEHFGMAVAEMVQAGCIVFAARGGGPEEILGSDQRLLYATREEAATKIIQAMTDPDLQISLRSHLGERKSLFSVNDFIRRIREIVDAFDPASTSGPAGSR